MDSYHADDLQQTYQNTQCSNVAICEIFKWESKQWDTPCRRCKISDE